MKWVWIFMQELKKTFGILNLCITAFQICHITKSTVMEKKQSKHPLLIPHQIIVEETSWYRTIGTKVYF